MICEFCTRPKSDASYNVSFLYVSNKITSEIKAEVTDFSTDLPAGLPIQKKQRIQSVAFFSHPPHFTLFVLFMVPRQAQEHRNPLSTHSHISSHVKCKVLAHASLAHRLVVWGDMKEMLNGWCCQHIAVLRSLAAHCLCCSKLLASSSFCKSAVWGCLKSAMDGHTSCVKSGSMC